MSSGLGLIPDGGALAKVIRVVVEVRINILTATVTVLAKFVTAGNVGTPRRQCGQGERSVVVTGRWGGAETWQ